VGQLGLGSAVASAWAGAGAVAVLLTFYVRRLTWSAELTWRRRLFGLWLPLAAVRRDRAVSVHVDGGHLAQDQRRAVRPKANPLTIRHPSLVHYISLLQETNFLTWIATRCWWRGGDGHLALARDHARVPSGAHEISWRAAAGDRGGRDLSRPADAPVRPMADLIGRLKLGNTLSAVMLTYPTLPCPSAPGS